MGGNQRTRPLVIAHRGNSSEAPENTRVAFQQAIDLGVDIIELDVNHTKDGHPVIFHGPDLKKTARVEGSIQDLSLRDSKSLDVGKWRGTQYSGERILSLVELLEFACGKVNLAVDLKTDTILPCITRSIRETGMIDHVVICGCTISRAQKVRTCDSRLSVGLNMDQEIAALARQDDPFRFCQEYLRQATENQLSPLNMNHKYITQNLVRMAHLRAVQVWAWTVDDPADMEKMIRLGVDAIYSNYPGRLLEILGE